MRYPRVRSLVPLLALLLLASVAEAQTAAQQAATDAADVERLIKALEVRAGSVVGELGAGDGALTLAMAKAVGDSGRVFTNELNPKSLDALRKKFDGQGVTNITVVEGRTLETNFPEGCCDAIFMRNVYHHFADPAAMNRSLFQSLKPGGRLAVIDFAPDDDEAPTPAQRSEDKFHGVKAAAVERELAAAGFEIVSSTTVKQSVTVVAVRKVSK
jgi:ubiquinone/menaquinone biosynthesis C-methylase UbiE